MLPVQLVQPLCTGMPPDIRCSASGCTVCTGLCTDLRACDLRSAGALLGMWNGRADGGPDGCPDDAAIYGSAGDANDVASPANVLPIADADVLCRS